MYKNVHKALILIVGYMDKTKHFLPDSIEQFCIGLKACCDNVVFSKIGIDAINFNYYDYPVFTILLRNNFPLEWVQFRLDPEDSDKTYTDLLDEYETLQIVEE